MPPFMSRPGFLIAAKWFYKLCNINGGCSTYVASIIQDDSGPIDFIHTFRYNVGWYCTTPGGLPSLPPMRLSQKRGKSPYESERVE